jgi:DNA-binding NtrC family response regulator
VPPLRDRPEDIADLARHFLARFAAEEGKRIRTLEGDALALLRTHPWPGNVRQLENAIFRATVLAEGDVIGVAEFPQIAMQIARGVATRPAEAPLPTLASEPADLADVVTSVVAPPMADGDGPVDVSDPAGPNLDLAPAMAPSPDVLPLLDDTGEVRPLAEIEAEAIRFAIAHYRGQMSEVARKLKIGRSTLYRRLEDLGLAERETDESGQEPVASG